MKKINSKQRLSLIFIVIGMTILKESIIPKMVPSTNSSIRIVLGVIAIIMVLGSSFNYIKSGDDNLSSSNDLKKMILFFILGIFTAAIIFGR